MAKTAKKGLGKGLGALLGGDFTEDPISEEKSQEKKVVETKIVEVPKEIYLKLSLIEPNKEQPRKEFDPEQLEELAESIRQYGVLQPIMVQKKGELYEIIAGERRWRAAKIAGLKEIPVIIREFDKQKKMEISLIENVQRSDLNPIEEARAYKQLIDEFALKQEEIAERVSKNRATVANSLRLLKLDPRIQELLIQGIISNGHARALLAIEDMEQQYAAAELIVKNGLSVREVEKLVKSLLKPAKEKQPKKEEKDLSFIFQDLEERMKSIMGTKVMIHRKDKSKGRIEIEYYSEAELERLVELIESIRN